MRKSVLSFILLLAALIVRAVPADPTPYKYIQPDGSVIILQNHGDEFFHWTTDESGQVVERGSDGFYRPVEINLAARIAEAKSTRSQMYARWSSYENPRPTNLGDRKVLCILANFTDIVYSVEDPKTHFSNMLNQEGYNLNGSIGSVRDYFRDNSGDKYRPQFDVFGPVNLSHNEEYYDTNGADKAIIEAYDSLMVKSPININDYDTDNDGAIDMILFYFPGYNQAEHGPDNTIWPYQSSGYFGMLGGKRFVRFFCTSELRGNSGTNPASIGTTCHEFAHSLGLPDFYDTDYEGSGGQNVTTGVFDLMSGGNYNDNGRRPPYLSALERNMLGWMDYPQGISAPGDYTLSSISNDQAYKIDSSNSGEYFILESRNGQKWDSTLPKGLLVYHVDKSANEVRAGKTAGDLWETNDINKYYGHPCYYLVPSVESASESELGLYVYPGTNNSTAFIPTDWSGTPTGMLLTNIDHNGSVSTFTVSLSEHRTVFGSVMDTDGNPLKDVQVSLTPSTGAFAAAPALLPTSISCMTDENGQYSLVIEDDDATRYQILMAQKAGYKSMCYNVTISSLYTEQDFTLLRNDECEPVGLNRYDSSGTLYKLGMGTGDVAISMRFTAAEITEMNLAGSVLKTVSFYAGAGEGQSVYVVVGIGNEMKLRYNVTSQYTPKTLVTYNISDANIIIPEGKDVYIGYGIDGIPTDGDNYLFYGFGPFTEDHGGVYRCTGFLTGSTWSRPNFNSGNFDPFISATVSPSEDVEFSALGVSYIKVEDGVPSVVLAAGKSLKETEWYLDGTLVETPAAVGTLDPGSHVYMVRLSYYDGTSERIFYEVDK